MGDGIMAGLAIIMVAIVASVTDIITSTFLLVIVSAIYNVAASISGSEGWLLPSLQTLISLLDIADAFGFIVFIFAIVGGIIMIISAPFDFMGRF